MCGLRVKQAGAAGAKIKQVKVPTWEWVTLLRDPTLSGAYRPSRETHINSVRYHRVSMAGKKEGDLLLFLICSIIRSLSNNFPSLTTTSTLGIQHKRRKREG